MAFVIHLNFLCLYLLNLTYLHGKCLSRYFEIISIKEEQLSLGLSFRILFNLVFTSKLLMSFLNFQIDGDSLNKFDIFVSIFSTVEVI